MKKTIVIAALTIASAPAFASKARLAALNGNTIAFDYQDIGTNPAKALELGSLISVEYGSAAGTNGLNKAEGGFLRASDDTTMGVYFNRSNATFDTVRDLAGVSTLSTKAAQANPVEFTYASKMGDNTWGLGLVYSNHDIKDGEKSSTMGLKAGYFTPMWNGFLNVGLLGTDKLDGQKDFKSDMSVKAGVEADVMGVRVYGDYGMASGKNTVGGADIKGSANGGTLGVEHGMKGEGSHFYYGIKYTSVSGKSESGGNSTTVTNSSWPVYAGIEADVNSWMVARTSFSQSVFNKGKSMSDTTAALGLGLRFGKLLVDGVMSTGATGNFNFNDGNGTNSFLSQVSATYTF